uniref:phenylalanine-tRNA ligase beta subunit n=1 Tax=Palisada intermedia TaxID=397057 RepID=UPI00286C65A7|nr:phenylalanine-tRNA ligase beta subunit [Palisada intermedia]WKW95621.1 phenylalanine-tRNA ligase beta subunit [Palisada intermedia]
MKFSWKLINIFINLESIQLHKFKEQLTLSGIEIEKIHYIEEIKDNILDLSITTNRREICSIVSLAKEIETILNKPLNILPINFFNAKIQENCTKFIYISINKINSLRVGDTPKWLINYLKIYSIKPTDTISNIEQYIEIKWGMKFYILNTKNLKNRNYLLNASIKLQQIALDKNNKEKYLIIFISNTSLGKNIINNINTQEEYYFNAYIDAMKLISTLTKCVYGKSYHEYKVKQPYSEIAISKNEIDTVLGKTNNHKFNQLSSKNIINKLKQLNLSPYYNKFLQTFTIKVPPNRRHDLQRKIDIIEEIGRVYGFNHFVDKLPSSKRKGVTSNISIKVKNLRNTLRNLGFNEVVNCCLINNYLKQNNYNIKIHNPITQEQTELRNNITQSLVENYSNNIKQNNYTVEIFEIGKTFHKNLNNNYIENISLGGLMHNSNFIKNNWSDTPKYANFFHLKGIIETVLEKLNAEVTFNKIDYKLNTEYKKNIEKLFNPQQRIGIYNSQNTELLGVLGEINPLYNKALNTVKNKIYLFEINISKLNKTIKLNNHLNYISKPCSNYPSVTRDISIKVTPKTNIKEIEKVVCKNQNMLIESIEIFNEYFNKQDRHKSVGVRITYRSQSRTLDSNDIKKIDNHINNILLHFKSKT